MTEELQKITKEELAKLPGEIQGAINSVDWAKISEEIAKKYLNEEENIEDFQTETLITLLGLQDYSDYMRQIENRVGTPSSYAKSMAQEADEKIFKPIVKQLESLAQKHSTDAGAAKNIDFITSGGNYSAFLE